MISHILSYQNEIFKAFIETGILIGIATLAALLIGLPLGILVFITKPNGLRPNRIAHFLGNLYINVLRSFPFLIFIVAMIPLTRLLLGKSLGTLPATLPLSCVAIAIYARFVDQALLEIPQETLDSAKSMGATLGQTIRYFLLVEARSSLCLGLVSSIISFISYSTVMGVVGGGGIGDFAMRYGYQRFDSVLMYGTVFILICLVQVIQMLGTRWARHLDKTK